MADLNDYIELHRYSKFEWGSLDCIKFVGKGVNYIGCRFFEEDSDWDYNTESLAKRSAVKLFRKHNVKDLPSLLDKHYERKHKYPSQGCIVARPEPDDSTTGYLLGFVSGRHGVYVGSEGLEFIPLDPELEMYWRVK